MQRWMRERRSATARGLLVLAAVMLLPLAATLQEPRQGVAQEASQDSLWAVTQTQIGVCESPASPAALSGCFATYASQVENADGYPLATDGVNVYLAGGLSSPGYSCPIAALGTNCTEIMAGPWPGGEQVEAYAIAAADDQIWIGQSDGVIYRCPNDLPWQEQSSAPPECVELDDAGDRWVGTLVLANGTLYAGLTVDASFPGDQMGIIWSCDPQTPNSCSNLDSFSGHTGADQIVAGGGYLWLGLSDGLILRCDPDTANACDNWDQAGYAISSLSYDGQGTLYAAVGPRSSGQGVIWSCPTASANGCSNLVSNVSGQSVAAGPDGVFSSVAYGSSSPIVRYGTSPYSAFNLTNGTNEYPGPNLLYLPADGPAGVGGAQVAVSLGDTDPARGGRCHAGGGGPKIQVTLRGPHGMSKSQKVGLCALRNGATLERTFSLLDPGPYEVSARTRNGAYSGQATLTVAKDTTTSVKLQIARTRTDR